MNSEYQTPIQTLSTATNWNQSCCCKNLYLKYVRSCCNAAAKWVQQDGANVDLILLILISSVLRLWFYYMWRSTESCGRVR